MPTSGPGNSSRSPGFTLLGTAGVAIVAVASKATARRRSSSCEKTPRASSGAEARERRYPASVKEARESSSHFQTLRRLENPRKPRIAEPNSHRAPGRGTAEICVEIEYWLGRVVSCRTYCPAPRRTSAKIAVFSAFVTPGIDRHCRDLGASAVFDKAAPESFMEWLVQLPRASPDAS